MKHFILILVFNKLINDLIMLNLLTQSQYIVNYTIILIDWLVEFVILNIYFLRDFILLPK